MTNIIWITGSNRLEHILFSYCLIIVDRSSSSLASNEGAHQKRYTFHNKTECQKIPDKQECIPVGCAPSTSVAISPALHTTPSSFHHAHLPCHACPHPLPHMPPTTHTPLLHTPPAMHAPRATHAPPAPVDRRNVKISLCPMKVAEFPKLALIHGILLSLLI